MNIKRYISLYEKKGDNLIEEIELKLPLKELVSIIQPKEDDELHKVYPLNARQIEQLTRLIPELSKINFAEVDAYYECFQD